MKKRLFSLLAALLCAALLILPASALTVSEALELLEQVYLREIPEEAYQAQTLEELFAALGDPYTYYMTAEEYKAFLGSVENTTDLVGIGVSIQYTDDGILVISALSGCSAKEAGVRDGDLIVSIDGVSCVPAKESHRELILGVEGTEVTITVLRDGETLEFTITRGPVVVPNTQVEVLDGHIGYIDCDSFGSRTGSYFIDGMNEYGDQVDCWIVDLRGNPGGYTSAAGEATGAFLGPCYYLYLQNRQGQVYGYIVQNQPLNLAGKVLVLLDANSASASEALAGNLRGNSVSIGDRTYGKGVAQVVLDQEQFDEYFDGDGMKVTAYRFYTLDGNTTDQVGVIPTLLMDADQIANAALALCGEADADLAFQICGDVYGVQPDTDEATLAALFAALPPSVTVYLKEDGATSNYTATQAAERLGLSYDSRWFTDVEDSPYRDEINTLATYRMLLGTGDQRFTPENRLTRAQMCAMLAQMLGVTYTGTESRFTDVSSSAWYFDEVNAIAALGLVNGVGGGRFSPNAYLTQQEYITIMGRAARYLNFAVDQYGDQVDEALASDQTDSDIYELLDTLPLDRFASWAQSSAAVLALSAQEMLNSPKSMLYAPLDELDPKAPILREEAAAGMYEILAGLGILNV